MIRMIVIALTMAGAYVLLRHFVPSLCVPAFIVGGYATWLSLATAGVGGLAYKVTK